jgi:hypothetical protein
MEIPNPRSKPPAYNHEKGRVDVQGRERGATVGAAEEEQRGREEATIEHAFDSILIPSPSLRCSQSQRCRLPRRRADALRGVASEEREREGAGEGTARRVEYWERKEAEEVGRLLMALARPCRTHTDTRAPRGRLLDRRPSVG